MSVLDDKDAIRELLHRYCFCMDEGRFQELAALFAEDGFVLSSGVPPVRGRAAIRRHYEGQGGPLSLRALALDGIYPNYAVRMPKRVLTSCTVETELLVRRLQAHRRRTRSGAGGKSWRGTRRPLRSRARGRRNPHPIRSAEGPGRAGEEEREAGRQMGQITHSSR